MEELNKLTIEGRIDFSDNVINKFSFSLSNKEHGLEYVISQLKDGEKLIFYLNDGYRWNGKQHDKSKMIYNEKYDQSILWENDDYGDFVRIDSDQGTVKRIASELDEIYVIKNDEE